MLRTLLCILLVGATASCTSIPAAGVASERYVALCGPQDPADSGSPCVYVLKIGSDDAKHIVVLVPGAYLGAQSLHEVGHQISQSVASTQVWAVERRQQALADLRGLGAPSQLDYYLEGHYQRVRPEDAARAKHWGLAATLSDLDRIVSAASARGKRSVVLGGHSWGATTTLAYAAWDFDGRAGYRNLAGLILIDGGVHDSFAGEGYRFRTTVEDARKALDGIENGAVFADDLGYLWNMKLPPEQPAIYYQLAASLALADPRGASPLQDRLPGPMQPNARLTNAALLGWLLDVHAPTPDLQLHAGYIGTGAGVHDWVSTGPADIDVVAKAFAHRDPAALEWFWPRRLSLDLQAVDPFVESPVTVMLGLKISHARDIDVPLFVFETGTAHGSVAQAAKWVVANSKISRAIYMSEPSMAHLDPLLDTPDKNKFLSTVIAFLCSLPKAQAC